MAKTRAITGAAFLLFALVVALYLPTLRGEFVYDSISQVLYNEYIHASEHWTDVLTLRVVGQDQLDRNRPLHLASLMLDAAIWGKNPFGYRLTSIFLHALNASLLFVFIALALTRRTAGGGDAAATFSVASPSPATAVGVPAAFGALLFALHPLVVEAVAEPSNREDLLVLFAMLIGLLCLAAPLRSRFAANTALVICSLFAVLAKESGAAVPFVFGVASLLFGGFKRCFPGLIFGFLAVGAFLVASYIWRPAASGIFAQPPGPLAEDFWTMLGVQSRIWTLQLWQIVWPWNLSAHYPPQSIGRITESPALGVLAVASVAAFFVCRASRVAALGVAVFVLALLPASNFVPQYQPIADRFLYVPLAGLAMIVAVMGHRLRMQCSRRSAGGLMLAAALIVLAAEYAANLRRQFIWQQPGSLWADVLRQYPDTAQAQLGIANVHRRAGDFGAALASANEAAGNSSGLWADPFACRAICQWKMGHRELAMEDFLQARRLSRVYQSENSMAEAMIFSPDQLAVLGELIRSAVR